MDDELIAEAELGEEARSFLESDLGKCILGMAKQEVALAQEALETVSPLDSESIMELQQRAKLYRNFEQWLNELLDKGQTALEVFRDGQTDK